jgi:hypothetical protein
MHYVQKVLQWLLDHNVYVKTENSTSVNFLGFLLTPGGVSMDENNITAVSSWPKPTTANFLWLGGSISTSG